MFQTLVVQPIYNILVAIYGIMPGHDLGVSLILFTILIRFAMWPLLKKQLRQNKAMQDLKPELKKIKKAAAGDKQQEGRLMMELYKENGISMFATLGLTLVQAPLFIGVFQAARKLTEDISLISSFTYGFVQKIPYVASVIANNANFNFQSFGFIDLSKKAIDGGDIYIPILILGIAATVFQFFQTKQIMPEPDEKKKLRDILRSKANDGKQPDQDDLSAAMGSTILYLMPLLTMLFAISAKGPMVMYLFAASIIGIIQQNIILGRDKTDMQAEVVSVKSTPITEKDAVTPPVKKVKATPIVEKPAKTTVEEKVKKKKGVVTTTRIITPNDTPKTVTQNQKAKKAARKKSKKRRR